MSENKMAVNNKNMNKKETRKKNILWTFVSIILAVLTVRVVIMQSSSVSFKELLSIIAASNKFFLFLAVFCAGIFVWAEGVAVGTVIKYAGYPRKKRQNLIYSTSDIYFSGITPSATGGQPASAFFMMRDGIPGGVATASLVLNLMMYTISIIVLGLVSIIISPTAFLGFNRFSKIFITVGFFGLSALSAAFLLILKKGSLLFDLLSRCVNMLYDKHIIKEKGRILKRLSKASHDYEACSDLIAGRKRVLFFTLLWNLVQRGSQMLVPAVLYLALGGDIKKAPLVYARQCLITIGYNFVPIPGGMGISDYLMIDGFKGIMGEQMTYQVELLSRGITFYICVAVCGLITLGAYFLTRNKKERNKTEATLESSSRSER